MKKVNQFSCQRSVLTADVRFDTEIKREFGIKMLNMLTSSCISIKTRKIANKTFVWSRLLYG